jgi:hypothetical protein
MRKHSLSPLQGELLRMLSEAGEVSLACIRATLGVADEAEFSRQVASLRRIGLVEESVESSSGLPSLILTELGYQSLLR